MLEIWALIVRSSAFAWDDIFPDYFVPCSRKIGYITLVKVHARECTTHGNLINTAHVGCQGFARILVELACRSYGCVPAVDQCQLLDGHQSSEKDTTLDKNTTLRNSLILSSAP